jgi:hypothetical protein
MRIDLYRLVHKAQRHRLFAFAQELGRADLDDADTRSHIARELHGIREMLLDHAGNEQRYIHPLFAKLGHVPERIEREHRELEAELAHWASLLDEERWPALYPATMRLIGEYLLHIDEEERAQAELLWPAYSDAELGAVFTRFKAERDPALARADLKLFLSALNASELAALFGQR